MVETINYSPYAKRVYSGTNTRAFVHDNGDVVYYSYATVIGVLHGKVLYENPRWFSVTTSKHKSFMRGDALKRGATDIREYSYEELPEEVKRHLDTFTASRWP